MFDFSHTTNVNDTKSGEIVPFRIFSQPDKVNDTLFAIKAGPDILGAIADYLGVPYPLPKMDQVAVSDFARFGMENWGLVTYK